MGSLDGEEQIIQPAGNSQQRRNILVKYLNSCVDSPCRPSAAFHRTLYTPDVGLGSGVGPGQKQVIYRSCLGRHKRLG